MKRTITFCLVTLTIILSAFVMNAAKWDNDKKSQRNPNLTEPMYEILGMLQEYISRFDHRGEPIPEFIDSFGLKKVDNNSVRFEELLVEYAKLTGLKKDWRKVFYNQDLVAFYSSFWSKIINTFYIIVEKNIATVNPAIFDHATQEEMLRFLQGVYSRFGLEDKSSAILMANASYKIETIAKVLKKLGCTNITIFVLRRLPALYQVHFNPSPMVKDKLKIEAIVSELRNMELDLSGWEVYKTIN